MSPRTPRPRSAAAAPRCLGIVALVVSLPLEAVAQDIYSQAQGLTFGTLQSRLWKVLDAGHYDAKLSRDEMHRVKCWIDLNCPLWPDYIQRDLRPASPQTAQAGR